MKRSANPILMASSENAQNMGNLFHHAPLPVRKFRDFVFDHSRIPGEFIRKGYLKESEAQVRRV